jgi:hypothetical protein
MKICTLRTELSRANRQTDRQTERPDKVNCHFLANLRKRLNMVQKLGTFHVFTPCHGVTPQNALIFIQYSLYHMPASLDRAQNGEEKETQFLSSYNFWNVRAAMCKKES